MEDRIGQMTERVIEAKRIIDDLATYALAENDVDTTKFVTLLLELLASTVRSAEHTVRVVLA